MWMCEQMQLVSRCTSIFTWIRNIEESVMRKVHNVTELNANVNINTQSTFWPRKHLNWKSFPSSIHHHEKTNRKQKNKTLTTKRANKLEEQTTELSFHCEDAPTAGSCHQARLNHGCCYSETQQGFLSVICDEMTISKIKTMDSNKKENRQNPVSYLIHKKKERAFLREQSQRRHFSDVESPPSVRGRECRRGRRDFGVFPSSI